MGGGRGLCGQNAGRADPKGPGSVSPPRPRSSCSAPGVPPAHLLCQFMGKVAPVLQSHVVAVEIGAPRESGVSGRQMRVDLAVDGGLHLDRITLINLGAHGWSAIRS